jgi:hypothetical protein
MPEHAQAWSEGLRVTTNAGFELEPLGTVVREQGGELSWTVSFLVHEAAQVITFNAGQVALSAPEGLLRDNSGNWTAAFAAVAAENLSLVDADGFSTQNFTRGAGGVTLYVSSTHGSINATFAEAQDPRTPIKSVQRAMELLEDNDQDGRGAAIKMLRGDIFAGPVGVNIGGQDRRHPLVLENYWFDYGTGAVDPRKRPVIQTDWTTGSTGGLRAARSGEKMNDGIDHVVVRGLTFKAVNRKDPEQDGFGMRLYSGGHNWLIDDVVINNFTHNISIQSLQAQFDEVTILRSIVIDAHLTYKTAPPVSGAFYASQGLFVSGTTGLMVSQSTFDRNGRTTANWSGRNYYSHNMYLSAGGGAGPATVWGNVIRAAGSHGVQMRAGGILAYNYLGRNVVAGFVDGVGGAITHNVVESAEDFNANEERGMGLMISTAQGTSLASVIERNIVVHKNSGAGEPIILWRDPAGNVENALIRNNTLVNAGTLNYRLGDAPLDQFTLRAYGNLVDARDKRAVYVRSGTNTDTDWRWLESDDNLYSSEQLDSAFRWFNDVGDLGAWRAETGGDLDSMIKSPAYVDGTAKIQHFGAANGAGSTEANFAARVRTRRPDFWPKYADMTRLFDFYAAAYRPKNLEALGSGPLDFHGAVDYRPAAPDLLASLDTGLYDNDNVTRTNSNLKFELRNTLTGATIELLRDGVKVATATGDSNKAITLVDPSTLDDGVYVYTVRQLGSGGAKILSPETRVTVDRTPPTQPDAPVLLGIDGGVPTFEVSASEANVTVELFRKPVGSGSYVKVASRSGGGAVSETTALPPGEYEYVTRIVDLAGNTSSYSVKLKVTIA